MSSSRHNGDAIYCVSTPDNAVDVEGVENFNRKERNDIRKERKVKGVDL
ncbi:MAG: hypothetical protein LBF59_05680 [Prevotellaceae bacterium]|nr:hypothetical protein [Prevotellaceae bacterium]